MNLLITGATGAVGRELVLYLLQDKNNKIITVNRSIEKAKNLLGEQSPRLIHFTINDTEEIIACKPEVIIHLAANVTSSCDLENGLKLIESNISYGVRLLEMVKQMDNVRLFLNFGTFAEYRKGGNKFDNAYLYSASKTAYRAFADFYASSSNYTLLHLVPFTVYGTKDEKKKVFDYIYEGFFSESMVPMTNGLQMLDFIHIKDICNIINKIIAFKGISFYNGHEIQLGTGRVHNLRQVATIMQKKIQRQPKHDWGKLPLRNRDVLFACANINFLIEINCLPEISLSDGIEEYLENRK